LLNTKDGILTNMNGQTVDVPIEFQSIICFPTIEVNGDCLVNQYSSKSYFCV